MKKNVLLYLAVFMLLVACVEKRKNVSKTKLFKKENLVAWCIVPFDSVERTPEERATMLSELGFTQFAYDWREKHLASFADEIRALKSRNINLRAVWMWIDTDSIDVLDSLNESLLETIKQNDVKTDLWLGFSNKHFDGLTDDQKLDKAVRSITRIQNRAKQLGCTVSLYNHGDWFGEPENQIRIIEKMGAKDVGIVYNFHHAHQQVQKFPELLSKMLPYLNTVNLNGMNVHGPKILTLGEGEEELAMLTTLRESGYAGSLGILCHIETEDAKVVLQRNLNGLKMLLEKMGETEALNTY